MFIKGPLKKKLSNFLADFVSYHGGGGSVKTNLLKIVDFQMKVCYFKLYSPHSNYKTTI